MRFEEALRSIRQGKKVRCGGCKCWMQLVERNPLTIGNPAPFIADANGDLVEVESYQLLSQDWVIVE